MSQIRSPDRPTASPYLYSSPRCIFAPPASECRPLGCSLAPRSKTDVANLLESAGFSKSNPYYIVQQGKITMLALMKDAERLALLMEVAGCKVYDERRAESERIMRDTEMRRDKVIEVVA